MNMPNVVQAGSPEYWGDLVDMVMQKNFQNHGAIYT